MSKELSFGIKRYYRLKESLDLSSQMRSLIVKKSPISTGLEWGYIGEGQKTNFDVMLESGVYVPRTGYYVDAHAINILDFSDQKGAFWASDTSLNLQWGNNQSRGGFWVPYNTVHTLLAKYVIEI